MSAGPTETEIKLRIDSAEDAEERLKRAGFEVAVERVFEANSIYDTPSGDLRARGCLLRLRAVGDKTVITFKGVSVPGRHKSRPEYEASASSFEAMHEIFVNLGYTVQFRYEKYRTEYRRPGEAGVATLDETPVGNYMELEGESDWIDRVAGELGFDEQAYIAASYSALYRDYCVQSRISPTHMVFAESKSNEKINS